jgi:hypothetical protein
MNFCLHSHRLLLGVIAIIFVTECHLVLLDVQQTSRYWTTSGAIRIA